MSASEKLKALDASTDDNAWFVGTTLTLALPQIVAVVEAAEELPELGEDNYLLFDLRAALTALEEKLS